MRGVFRHGVYSPYKDSRDKNSRGNNYSQGQSFRGSRQNACGFTLIELMVVLLVLGVVGVMAPVAWKAVMPGVTLRSEASEMSDLLRQLRAEAITNNKSAVFELDINEKSYRAGLLGVSQSLSKNIEVRFIAARDETAGGSVGGIRFYPDGSTTGGQITLSTPKGQSVLIRVDWLTGRVTVEE
ncbi:GspH/FimT family protein [Kiloniella majae]|uniref:GspH/FimT family protein n=1 Tax=Kiloniella majae TaxID=1938558 RepID=UPI000A278ED2|nr:GspH/FimT family protein [Kiloniella majae]